MRKQDFAHTNIYLTVTSTKDEHCTVEKVISLVGISGR